MLRCYGVAGKEGGGALRDNQNITRRLVAGFDKKKKPLTGSLWARPLQGKLGAFDG